MRHLHAQCCPGDYFSKIPWTDIDPIWLFCRPMIHIISEWLIMFLLFMEINHCLWNHPWGILVTNWLNMVSKQTYMFKATMGSLDDPSIKCCWLHLWKCLVPKYICDPGFRNSHLTPLEVHSEPLSYRALLPWGGAGGVSHRGKYGQYRNWTIDYMSLGHMTGEHLAGWPKAPGQVLFLTDGESAEISFGTITR